MTQSIAPPKRKHNSFLVGDLKDFQERPLEMEQAMMDVTMGVISRTMLSKNILED